MITVNTCKKLMYSHLSEHFFLSFLVHLECVEDVKIQQTKTTALC